MRARCTIACTGISKLYLIFDVAVKIASKVKKEQAAVMGKNGQQRLRPRPRNVKSNRKSDSLTKENESVGDGRIESSKKTREGEQ